MLSFIVSFFLILSKIKRVGLYSIILLQAIPSHSQNLKFERTSFATRPPDKFCIDSTGNYYIQPYDTVYRSVNQGTSWEPLPKMKRIGFANLRVSRDNKLYVFDEGVYPSVYRSSDFGSTWDTLKYIRAPHDIIFDLDSNVYVLGNFYNFEVYRKDSLLYKLVSPLGSPTSGFITLNKTFIAYGTNTKITTTQNKGTSWSTIQLPGNFHQVNSIAQIGSTIIMATDIGLLRSTDDANSWTPLPLFRHNVVELIKDKKGSFYCAVDDTDALRGFYVSNDSGQNWSPIFSTPTSSGGRNRIIVNTINDVFLSLGDNGLFMIKHNEEQPTKFFNYPVLHNFYSANTRAINNENIVLESCSDGSLFAGCQNYFVRSDDTVSFWFKSGPSSPLETFKDNQIYAFNSRGFVYSTNNGKTWISKDAPIVTSDEITAAALTRNKEIVLTGVTNNVYLTRDLGKTWTTYQSALSSALKLLSLRSGSLMLISNFFEFRKSTDLGKSWSGLSSPTPLLAGDLNYPTFSVASWGDIYITCDTFLYRSTDEGASWQSQHSELQPRTIIFRGSKECFIGTVDGRILYSSDRGVHFKELTSDLPKATIQKLALDSVGNFYVLQTVSDAKAIYLYKTKAPAFISSVNPKSQNIPSTYSVRVCPNPVIAKTTFSSNLLSGEYCSIKIFNSLGNEITTLTNQILPEGEHKFEFDASYLPSGLYYYRLQIGNQIETKPLIVAH